MRKLSLVTLLAFLTLLVVVPVTSAAGEQASGDLKDKDGKVLGKVSLSQDSTGKVKITVNYSGIPVGDHGVHLHAVGKCDGPDFASAGGHFNPDAKKHGNESGAGPHAGDIFKNINVAANGSGTFDYTTDLVTLSAGPKSLFDADGTALVIHAGPDDFKTDPAGNSGARIACAVLTLNAPANAPAAVPATGLGGGSENGGSSLLLLVGLGLLAIAAGVTLVGRKLVRR